MSLEWMGRVWAEDYGSSAKKLVALVIADCHNAETGQCNPGPAYIAQRTNLSVGNVRKHLAALAAEGHFTRPYPGGNWTMGARNDARDVEQPTRNSARVDAQQCAPERATVRVEARNSARTTGREPEVEPEGEPEHATGGSLVLASGAVFHPASDVSLWEQQPTDHASSFDAFWRVYPRKAGKEAARKAWAQAVKRADPAVIIGGAANYRDDPNRVDQFTAHPSTWLNQGRWDDDPLPERADRRDSPMTQVQRVARMMGGGRS